MRPVSMFVAFTLPFLLIGCGPDSPVAVQPDAVAPALSSHAGVVAQAAGSGHTAFAGGLRVFTFTAQRHEDGTADGRFRIGLNAIDAWFSADVTCLSTDDSTAWVGGIIAATNVPDLVQVGSASEFYAVDNGEGSADAADIVSTATFNGAPGTELAFCADQPLALPPRTVEEGNVQVSGGP